MNLSFTALWCTESGLGLVMVTKGDCYSAALLVSSCSLQAALHLLLFTPLVPILAHSCDNLLLAACQPPVLYLISHTSGMDSAEHGILLMSRHPQGEKRSNLRDAEKRLRDRESDEVEEERVRRVQDWSLANPKAGGRGWVFLPCTGSLPLGGGAAFLFLGNQEMAQPLFWVMQIPEHSF